MFDCGCRCGSAILSVCDELSLPIKFFSGLFGVSVFFFQAEDGIRDLVRSRGLGDVYKRQKFSLSREKEKSELPCISFSFLLVWFGFSSNS